MVFIIFTLNPPNFDNGAAERLQCYRCGSLVTRGIENACRKRYGIKLKECFNILHAHEPF